MGDALQLTLRLCGVSDPRPTRDRDLMSTATTVRWDRASKRFGHVVALDDFSLSLGAGVHCILGANGAGKSTAFALLTGARRPDRGTVWVADLQVRRGGEASKLIGFAPQAVTFPATLTVQEALRLVAAHYPTPASVQEVLDWAGLAPQARSLCGGPVRWTDASSRVGVRCRRGGTGGGPG